MLTALQSIQPRLQRIMSTSSKPAARSFFYFENAEANSWLEQTAKQLSCRIYRSTQQENKAPLFSTEISIFRLRDLEVTRVSASHPSKAGSLLIAVAKACVSLNQKLFESSIDTLLKYPIRHISVADDDPPQPLPRKNAEKEISFLQSQRIISNLSIDWQPIFNDEETRYRVTYSCNYPVSQEAKGSISTVGIAKERALAEAIALEELKGQVFSLFREGRLWVSDSENACFDKFLSKQERLQSPQQKDSGLLQQKAEKQSQHLLLQKEAESKRQEKKKQAELDAETKRKEREERCMKNKLAQEEARREKQEKKRMLELELEKRVEEKRKRLELSRLEAENAKKRREERRAKHLLAQLEAEKRKKEKEKRRIEVEAAQELAKRDKMEAAAKNCVFGQKKSSKKSTTNNPSASKRRKSNQKTPKITFKVDSLLKDEIRAFVQLHQEAFPVSDLSVSADESQKASLQLPRLNTFSGFLPEREFPAVASRLSIHANLHEILKSIEENDVTFITGATGSGKTTQMPQFLLFQYLEWKKTRPRLFSSPPRVVMTQPRRIAATSLAKRIGLEVEQNLGVVGCVGHSIRFELSPPPNTQSGSLVVCTAGILLRRLEADPFLDGYSHVILDEVHEREISTDILLYALLRVLKRRPKSLKIILMSATATVERLQHYFTKEGFLVGVPFSKTETTFPISMRYLEDFAPALLAETDGKQSSSEKDSRDYVKALLDGSDSVQLRTPTALIVRLIWQIIQESDHGAILVFLPGMDEIKEVNKALLSAGDGFFLENANCYQIFMLHSQLSGGEFDESVFAASPQGMRKIILSTNVAESSVTIPDVVFVIDSALQRVASYDYTGKIRSLLTQWINFSNLKQRIGRAGRCSPGTYYSLATKKIVDSLQSEKPAEILRSHLDSDCLRIKRLFPEERIEDSLSKFLDPPPEMHVASSVSTLSSLNAINLQGALCSLGRTLARLPLEPTIGKLLLLGCIFRCLDPVLTVVALGSDSIYKASATSESREALKSSISCTKEKLQPAGLSDSDHLIAHHHYQQFLVYGDQYCERNHLNPKVFFRIQTVRGQLEELLISLSIIPSNWSLVDYNVNGENHFLLRYLLSLTEYSNIVWRRSKLRLHNERIPFVMFATNSACYSSKSDSKESALNGVDPQPDKNDVDSGGNSSACGFYFYSEILKTDFQAKISFSSAIPSFFLLMIPGVKISSVGGVFYANGWVSVDVAAEDIALIQALQDCVNRFIDSRLALLVRGTAHNCMQTDRDESLPEKNFRVAFPQLLQRICQIARS